MERIISWPRGNAGIAVVTLASCLILILILDHGRGIWLDEATSFALSGHDIGFARIVTERWLSDVHPPLFSLYAWALQPLFGASVQAMRLINLGGPLYAGLVWHHAGRRGINRKFLTLFAVLVASSPFFILYAAEFRSYFFQLVLGACLIIALRMVHEGRGGLGWLGLTALLLINLHYLDSLVALILIGAEAIHLAVAGRRRAMLMLLGIMAVAVVPLGLALLAMLSVIAPVAVNEVSAVKGLTAIAAVAGAALLPNVAALVALVRVKPPLPVDRAFTKVLVGALAAIMIVYFLLNLATHNLLPRHMIAAVPIAAALAALLLEDRIKTRRRVFALICANAVLVALIACGYGLAHKRWESNVGRIEAAQARCPQSHLYALDPMSLLAADDRLHSVPDIDHYFGSTYALIAHREGFDVAILPDGKPVEATGQCPALLWIEHLYARPHSSDEALARVAGFAGPITVARLQRGKARALLAVSAAK